MACTLHGYTGLTQSLKGAVFCLLLMFILPLRVGGGDIKLVTACGAWLGWPLVQGFLGWTAILTAVATIMWAVKMLGLRGLLTRLKEETAAFVFKLKLQPLGSFPMAPVIAVGYLAALINCA